MQIPNIRDCIIPDPGMVLIEVDLKQADAQIVAWASDDAKLKSMFRRGIDIYTEQETGVWSGPDVATIPRQIRKNCVHSTNYGAGYRTLAERYMGAESAAKHFIDNWFHHHPSIRNWQRRIQWDLQQSNTPRIRNIFGYQRTYACTIPITQPLAWIGQSTVARVNKQMLLNYWALSKHLKTHSNTRGIEILWTGPGDTDLLMPNHDSVLMQADTPLCPDIFPELLRLAAVPIPYDDPLIIPAELKYSERSWGHMETWYGSDTTEDQTEDKAA